MLGEVVAATRRFEDHNVNAGVVYHYDLFAFDAARNYSAPVTVEASPLISSDQSLAPYDVVATPSRRAVHFSWRNPRGPGWARTRIRQLAGLEDPFGTVLYEGRDTTCVVSGLEPNVRVVFDLDGCDAELHCSASPAVTVMPVAAHELQDGPHGGAPDSVQAVNPHAALGALSSWPRVRAVPSPASLHAGGGISFAPLPSGATLRIYTVSGRLVRHLSARGAGLQWDCKTEFGTRVAPGVYLYRLEWGTKRTQRGRLVLVR